jgi:hypothetical protein
MTFTAPATSDFTRTTATGSCSARRWLRLLSSAHPKQAPATARRTRCT